MTDDERKKRKRPEKFKKPIPPFFRLVREEYWEKELGVSKAIAPMFPGQVPPYVIQSNVNTNERQAQEALTAIGRILERMSDFDVEVEKERVASLLFTVAQSRDSLHEMIDLARRMIDLLADRRSRAEHKLSSLQAAGGPEREIAATEHVLRQIGIGQESYKNIISGATESINIINSALEGLKEDVEELGLRVP